MTLLRDTIVKIMPITSDDMGDKQWKWYVEIYKDDSLLWNDYYTEFPSEDQLSRAIGELPCPHEDNVTYGKEIKINKLNRVLQMFCESCEAYGTVYEQREKHSSNDDWYQVKEAWHELKDYRRVD